MRAERGGGGSMYEGENREARGATPYFSRPSLAHVVSTADPWRHKYIAGKINNEKERGDEQREAGAESRHAQSKRGTEKRDGSPTAAEILEMGIGRTISSLGGRR